MYTMKEPFTDFLFNPNLIGSPVPACKISLSSPWRQHVCFAKRLTANLRGFAHAPTLLGRVLISQGCGRKNIPTRLPLGLSPDLGHCFDQKCLRRALKQEQSKLDSMGLSAGPDSSKSKLGPLVVEAQTSRSESNLRLDEGQPPQWTPSTYMKQPPASCTPKIRFSCDWAGSFKVLHTVLHNA